MPALAYTKAPHPTWASSAHQSTSGDSECLSNDICAKLMTTNRHGRREVIALSVNKPATIGRNPTVCSYVLSDIVVSSVHCKIYAVPSGDGGVIVSCQDLSTNGIILNGHKIRKTSVILMDNDILEIPSSQTFKCIHVLKQPPEKASIFEPTPPQQASHKQIGAYTVTSHCLGRGSFASVHLAMDTAAHRQVACKIIKTKKENEWRSVMKEVRILLALNHPNINRVYDVEVNGKFLHIFLQLCTGGELFAYIVSHKETQGRLCEGEAKYITYQLLRGLMYLHDKMICHRDLKPENILLHSPGPYPRVLIADFGLARPKAYQETLNACGTVSYLPPEGILALDNKNLGYVGMPSDCWSVGVILYIMLTGTHPFDYEPLEWGSSYQCDGSECGDNSQFSRVSVDHNRIIKDRIVRYQLDFDHFVWNSLYDAKVLVGRMLVYDYRQRATVYAAIQSTWIACDLDALETAYRSRVGSG